MMEPKMITENRIADFEVHLKTEEKAGTRLRSTFVTCGPLRRMQAVQK